MSGKAPQKNYEVFVSFRGEDIRHNFLSHLVDAFRRKQIYAFVDDKLKRGDELSSSFSGAIETSLISVVIFSEDYASSRWCLEELEKIVECTEKDGQTIIPIFYNVDPTNVRHQKESYGNAIAKHEEKYNSTKVQTWKDALTKCANLSGIKSSDFRDDVKLIEEIIKTVNDELMMRLNKLPIQSKGLIGVGKPIAHLEKLLRKDSKDVRVIGIWGMGGIGKTTIAQEVFNKLSSEYDGFCFLANVREVSERAGETISLKEKLFSTLLGEGVKINTVNESPHYVIRRLSRMKVLIVLDDVNDSEQLEKLVGYRDSFGSGSRIIVTTRDKQVFANEVDDDDIYKVGELDFDEALKLFNLNAFKQDHLEMEYSEHSKGVVNYARGIPLVLKVLGRLLCGKGKEIWESLLDKLKRMPNKEVHNVMRLSYDGLDRREKKIFLDLACFLSGLNLKLGWIKNLLKDRESDNSVAIDLERLKDKALITFSVDNVVSVHDILKEMAWEIVRRESSEDLGSHRRFEDLDDIYEVLKNDRGIEAIRSIWVDLPSEDLLSEDKLLEFSAHTFAKSSKLQFLYFVGGYFRSGWDSINILAQSLPTTLRYLLWWGYPRKSLPQNFSAEKLVILKLSHSKTEKLWDGVQNLVNLKEVILYSSESLTELPDFSKATNLEVLDVSYCEQLISVHIFSRDKLEKLDASGCSSLIRLTSDAQLTSLNYLNLSRCYKLRETSVTSGNMIEPNLIFTSLDAFASFGHQSRIEILDFEGCDIESLPSSIKNLTRLRHLTVDGCQKLQTLPELHPSLETLIANDCSSLETVLFPSKVTEQFNENRRNVEFLNCWNLDEHSLMAIELNARINTVNFVQHISSPEHDYFENDGAQATYEYVYPGSRVPEWFEYKTTNNDVIIDLSSTPPSPPLGFIFCFIVEKGQLFCPLIFDISISDGEGKYRGSIDMKMFIRSYSDTRSNNVFMMYDHHCSRFVNSWAKSLTRVKINVTVSSELLEVPDGSGQWEDFFIPVKLKCFGVSPISPLADHNFIHY